MENVVRNSGRIFLFILVWGILSQTLTSCFVNTNLTSDEPEGLIEDDPEDDSSTALYRFEVSGDVTGTAGFCYTYTIVRKDLSGDSLPGSDDSTIILSGGDAKFYSEIDCGGPTSTSIIMEKDTSTKTFYMRNAAAESFSLKGGDGVGTDGSLNVSLAPITASLVLGQPDFTTNKGLRKGFLGAPNFVHTDGTRFFVSDSSGNRVLIWNSLPTSIHQAPDLVLGQPDFTSSDSNYGGVSDKSLSNPSGIFSTGTKLYVSDGGNNRILIWNTMPTANFVPADIVIGQPDFVSNADNQGGALNSQTLKTPWNVIENGGKLFVLDNGNDRVLIFNSIPTVNNAAADVVVGQPDMLTTMPNYPSGLPTNQNLADQPRGLHVQGTKLFIADYLNHRVLIYNTIPTANYAMADVVLGQSDFISNSANTPSRSAQTFNKPNSVQSDGTRLIVADYDNHRVLIWNSIPTIDQQAADVVLGQPNMTSGTSNNGGIGADTLRRPYYAISDGTRIFVADFENNRVLQWSTIPTVNKTAANFVLGQHNFTSTATSNGGVDAQTFASSGGGPRGLFVDPANDKLFLADYLNWRVLVWNTIPTVNNTPADIVLCQPDMTTAALPGTTTAANSKKSNATFVSGTRLYEADHDNNRILVWNTIPTIDNADGDFAIGQPNLTTGSQSSGGLSAGIKRPQHVFEDGAKLFVADSENRRVLIWNTIPNTSGVSPNVVLGQPDFTTNGVNTGGIGPATMSNPNNIYSTGTKLVVAESNRRVLIWNSIPTLNGTAADLVLGQPDFLSATNNNGGLSASSISTANSLASDGTRLIVGDPGNNRILIWMTWPTTNFQPADIVIGQPNMQSSEPNNGGLSATSVRGGSRLWLVNNDLWVTDSGNSRILKFSIPSI